MSRRPLQVCAEPGCTALVRAARCDRHRRERREQPKRQSPRKAGYSARWDRESKRYREEYPLCELCLLNGDVRATQAVDHIIPHRGNPVLMWDDGNWCAICWRCHTWKTRQEKDLGTWTPHPRRLVLCGLPAVGKTTLANELAEEWGCDLWDADVWKEERIWAGGLYGDDGLEQMRAARGRWVRQHANSAAAIVIASHPVAAMFIAQAMSGTLRHLVLIETERQARIANRMKPADVFRGA
jgi:5-methylcytosine-specific restriction protein A